MDFSFLDLKCKEVVNVVDGKRLGMIIDVVLDLENCRVQGFIVPGIKSGFNLFRSAQDIFIPLNQVVRIGQDAILVELFNISAPTDSRISSYTRKQEENTTKK